jgi:hypothetical protein
MVDVLVLDPVGKKAVVVVVAVVVVQLPEEGAVVVAELAPGTGAAGVESCSYWSRDRRSQECSACLPERGSPRRMALRLTAARARSPFPASVHPRLPGRVDEGLRGISLVGPEVMQLPAQLVDQTGALGAQPTRCSAGTRISSSGG